MNPPDTTPPNGSAYTHTEFRSGPPLRYVAEKLRASIEVIRWTRNIAVSDIPYGLKCPRQQESDLQDYDPKLGLIDCCLLSFRYAMISYLAMHNLLGVAHTPGIFERLFDMPDDDFKRWLDSIESEGSVT